MKDRIIKIMNDRGMTAMQFCEATGIKQATISHIINGRQNASLEILLKINAAFPELSMDWLSKGKEATKKPNPADYADSLFSNENLVEPTEETNPSEYRKEIEAKPAPNGVQEIVKETIKYIEKPQRKITEIKIFYDDDTFETLKP